MNTLLIIMLVAIVVIVINVYRTFETPIRLIERGASKVANALQKLFSAAKEDASEEQSSTNGMQLMQIYRGECSKCHRVFYGTNQDSDDGVKLFSRTLNGHTINVCSSCTKIIDTAFTEQSQSGITDCSPTVKDMLRAATATEHTQSSTSEDPTKTKTRAKK